MTGRRLHDHLLEDRRDAIAILRIDREESLGALSRGLVLRLGEYLEELRSSDDVRVLVLTGSGKGFIAGADIAEYQGVPPVAFDEYQWLSRKVFTALEALPQFTIAAVNGYALGGGFEVALCCDMILASERAKFGLPEVKLGLVPGGGGTQRLSRAAGTRFAKEVAVTGRFYGAHELVARGIVSEVCSPEDLLATAERTALLVAGNAPLAVRAVKRLVNQSAEMSLDVGLALEQHALSALFRTHDGAEGVAAFLEKRQPRFIGE